MEVFQLLYFLGGVKPGVGFWDDGPDFGEMGSEFFGELFDKIRLFFGKILFFANVFLDIVELFAAVFVRADEFVVAFADNAGRFAALVPIVWIVPVEDTLGVTSFESGDE